MMSAAAAARRDDMGYRLSKIYTRTGDDGSTGLAGGQRVPKHDLRIAALGDVDETSSAIAVVLAEPEVSTPLRETLLRIQNELFNVGAELALPGHKAVTADEVERLERELDALNQSLPPLEDFVLPGGSRSAAACYLARAVARRAERTAWALASEQEVDRELLRYLNRLSDFLFVAARRLTLDQGIGETLWQKKRV
jgi:cob(I)alamin adenosyltransferase